MEPGDIRPGEVFSLFKYIIFLNNISELTDSFWQVEQHVRFPFMRVTPCVQPDPMLIPIRSYEVQLTLEQLHTAIS